MFANKSIFVSSLQAPKRRYRLVNLFRACQTGECTPPPQKNVQSAPIFRPPTKHLFQKKSFSRKISTSSKWSPNKHQVKPHKNWISPKWSPVQNDRWISTSFRKVPKFFEKAPVLIEWGGSRTGELGRRLQYPSHSRAGRQRSVWSSGSCPGHQQPLK